MTIQLLYLLIKNQSIIGPSVKEQLNEKKYKHLLWMVPSIFLSTLLKFFFFFINFLTPIKCERTRQFPTFGCYRFFFGGFHFFFGRFFIFFGGIFFFRWTPQYWVIFLFIFPFIYFLKNIGISFSIPTVNLKLPRLDKAIPLSTRILDISVDKEKENVKISKVWIL